MRLFVEWSMLQIGKCLFIGQLIISFAAELPRAPKTQAELQAMRLIQSQGSGAEPTEQPNPTVTDWVDRLSDVPAHRLPTEKIGEALPEDQELYSELLGRALVKLHIQK